MRNQFNAKVDTQIEGITKGNHHILFKKIIPRLAIENPPITEVTLYLSTFQENKINLAEILNSLNELTPEDSVKLRINSPGGKLTEGKAIINSLQNTGALITTELLSDGASMAAIMFCIGDKRIIYEHSTIMFHTFSSGYAGKGAEIESYIKHATKSNDAFFKAHILGLTNEEIQKMTDGKEYWFGAKKMCERGIATHVVIRGLQIPAKKYLKLLKKVKKVAKKNFPKEKIRPKSMAEALIFGIDALTPIAEENQHKFNEVQEKLTELLGSYEHDDS